jgi:hypothetical protein
MHCVKRCFTNFQRSTGGGKTGGGQLGDENGMRRLLIASRDKNPLRAFKACRQGQLIRQTADGLSAWEAARTSDFR